MARRAPSPERGNYISEWFGQRIYPDVRVELAAITGQNAGTCNFLSNVLDRNEKCVKNENSLGVCTISSNSNGLRQDWLACPYRVIDSAIVSHACQIIFKTNTVRRPRPVSILKNPAELADFKAELSEHGHGFLFFQDKLGGEISVLATDRSPEISFDVTLIEVTLIDGNYDITRYGILEIQTMDFHGSYKHAVSDLRDALRLHPKDFSDSLKANPHWAGNAIEGPNIANVFKRTFYQMLLKFKLAGRGAAAGTVLALPKSVWDSWQPFLGRPNIGSEDSGLMDIGEDETGINSFICIFDLSLSEGLAISPVNIVDTLRVTPEKLADHAFHEVPNHIISSIEAADSILARIRLRLTNWWPDLQLSSSSSAVPDVGAVVVTGAETPQG